MSATDTLPTIESAPAASAPSNAESLATDQLTVVHAAAASVPDLHTPVPTTNAAAVNAEPTPNEDESAESPPASDTEEENDDGDNTGDELEETYYWHDQIINELFRAARDGSPLRGAYSHISTFPGVDRMGNFRHTARAAQTGEVVLLRQTPLAPPVEGFFGQRLINELFLMRDMLPSPNVLGFYDLYLSKDGEESGDEDDEDEEMDTKMRSIWLVQQYLRENASLGELIAYNNGPGGFTEEQVARICLETTKGLAHLHKQLIIHRDIRSDSILVDPKGRVKITNFAYAVQLPTPASKRRTMVSTLALPARSPYTPDKTHWTSPEVIRRREYGHEVDVWALGITMMEMLDGRPPHSGNAALRVLFLILISGTPALGRPDADNLGADLRDFLSKCVEVNVEQRASAEALVDHEFLKRACPPSELAALFEYRTREAPADSEEEEGEEEAVGPENSNAATAAATTTDGDPEAEGTVDVPPAPESAATSPAPADVDAAPILDPAKESVEPNEATSRAVEAGEPTPDAEPAIVATGAKAGK
ncbi:Pkinase-domain-containing protein [Mycena kentingensis (nom. inval.)]|nr:Pkinase-domain-containing protein [Mycena kentingensis (nom. inval.)]